MDKQRQTYCETREMEAFEDYYVFLKVYQGLSVLVKMASLQYPKRNFHR